MCDAGDRAVVETLAPVIKLLTAERAAGSVVTLDSPWVNFYRGNAKLMRWATEHDIPYDEIGGMDPDTTHILVGDCLFPVVGGV